MARTDDRFTPDHGDTITRTASREHDFATPEEIDLDELNIADDAEDDAPFRRVQKRVPVRKGPVTKKTATRLRYAIIGGALIFAVGVAAFELDRYATHSWRFRLESSDNIETTGLQNVSRAQVIEHFGADLGRNVFRVSLDERKHQLEQIPWVESATVMRLLPDHLRISIKERTPVAFAQVGSKIWLIDANGVLMELPLHQQTKYSFPVITGMVDSEPLSTRAARMHIYARLMQELDANGANYSKDMSEIELTDPEDVRVTVDDPAGAVAIHLGSANFLERYKIYIAHVQEWRQQFNKIHFLDLRYSRQIIVNPDARGNGEKIISKQSGQKQTKAK